MVRLMVVTFAFLAWAFYMMSGGANFDPDRARLDSASPDPLQTTNAPEAAKAEPPAEAVEVTRVSLDLTSVEDVVSGRDDTPTASTRPQQPLPDVETTADTKNVEIIPSLVENATPETALSAEDATDANFVTETVSLERGANDSGADIRVVGGTRVNVRGGPGTSHGIVDTLDRGVEVEVLEDPGTGWVRIRDTGAGTEGWMAASLLTRG